MNVIVMDGKFMKVPVERSAVIILVGNEQFLKMKYTPQ